ncbi:nucleotidyltransferase family protein [Candidatus Thiosymbion oneisti]|uniref:nucleotidyltransferase family protein n=1 Tax=Candidatus Thiosymbion oneisti TaxID=589554 RepID=UPI0010621366|nr:nucleotidyltransferase domain-containing protein [Candidatus Thiosymbion oneisti]
MDSNRLDLRPRHAAMVRDILHRLVPDRSVWAFGSRVTGKARRYSDLDLVVMGDRPLPSPSRQALQEAFEESDLPFRVDVLDWADTDAWFREIIKANCIPLVQYP